MCQGPAGQPRHDPQNPEHLLRQPYILPAKNSDRLNFSETFSENLTSHFIGRSRSREQSIPTCMGAQLLPIGSNKSMATQTIQIETPDVWVRLADSPQWEALTESQKVFVLEFLTTGSVLQATKAAYNTSSEQHARVLRYELSKNPTIR